MPLTSSIKAILKNRRMNVRSLSDRTKIEFDRLRSAVAGEGELSENEIQEIAKQLGVPRFALFFDGPLPLSELPDFRRSSPSVELLQTGSIKAIGFVEKLSLSLASLDLDLDAASELEKYDGPVTRDQAKELAEIWRKRWGMDNGTQLEWKDANKLYTSLRQFIEELGVFVLHYNFGEDDVSGLYARVDGGPHTILVNTRGSSKARKLFTLAHEFCHTLLRADGISNATVAKNKIEIFCNQFAASLLAPRSLILQAIKRYGYEIDLFDDSIRLLSKNLGISQQALVLRLVDVNLLQAGDYSRWLSQFGGKTPPGDTGAGEGGGGSSPDPIKNKKTQYGYSLIKKLSQAKSKGLLDDIDIYRLSGIKPKYQNELFGG